MKFVQIVIILLLFCDLIRAEEIIIVAHRGASAESPENTIAAFELAWTQGADAIEGDFHLTKDGHIVCIHDRNTEKVSGEYRVVNQSTLAELRTLDVGAYYGKAFAGSVIPTIAEVFATIPEQKIIYVEIKSDAKTVPVLLEEIKASGLKQEQIVVISFNKEVIQALKAQAPQYKALWLSDFEKDASGQFVPSLDVVLRTLKQVKADGLGASSSVTEPLIKGIEEHGYEWHVWTVDDPVVAVRFQRWGAKSITTNVPYRIRKHFAEHEAATQ